MDLGYNPFYFVGCRSWSFEAYQRDTVSQIRTTQFKHIFRATAPLRESVIVKYAWQIYQIETNHVACDHILEGWRQKKRQRSSLLFLAALAVLRRRFWMIVLVSKVSNVVLQWTVLYISRGLNLGFKIFPVFIVHNFNNFFFFKPLAIFLKV